MKTTKPELEVPDAAIQGIVDLLYDQFTRETDGAIGRVEAAGWVRAIATPVVIAELRAQAALIRRSAKYGPSDAWMTHKLDRRAGELEAGA